MPALSPLEDRYRKHVKDLIPIMGGYGLNYYRVIVEIKWLLKLAEISEITEVPLFSEDAKWFLQGLIDQFSEDDFEEIKKIENITNHDVKAVEYFLKKKCQSHPEIAKVLEFFHFACTSEDINNLAHALMLKEAMNDVMFPAMDRLIEALCTMANDNAHISLRNIHGQSASPTTLGKEMAKFAVRLSGERKELSQVEILGKFAGAVGNYNAHLSAYPDLNWPVIAQEFVESLGLCFNPYVTQIESHDYMARIFHSFIQFNNILMGFDKDVWDYISLGYFKQTTKAGEIGSSTMPHKVNPIDFENSEGNLGMANAGFSHLSVKLPISRWQRDLTDSAVLRTMGVMLGHSLLAYEKTLQGIGKLQVNEARLSEDLNQCLEVLAEPIQTVSFLSPSHTINSLTPAHSPTSATANTFRIHSGDLEFSTITSQSPLDCRYREKVEDLACIIGEYGLNYYRVIVEIKWLMKLSEISEITEVPPFSEHAKFFLQGLIDDFSEGDVKEIKKFEKITNHDVKAVQYFLKKKCQSHPEIAKVLEFFHSVCTTEDINNVAHALMLREAMNSVMFPAMDKIIKALCTMAKDNAHISMLSRTHGQPASPTTLGKEMAIFATRLSRERKVLSQIENSEKSAGAVGNYDAHLSAYPDVNWSDIAQIETHDYMAKIFQSFIRFNTILIDFDRDVCGYISLGYFKQTTEVGEIDFEESDDNLDLANGVFSQLSMKLPITRRQNSIKDTSFHFNHSLLAYKSTLQGIEKLQVNEGRLSKDLNQCWEVLAEPIQTVMRRYGDPEPYEKLKELTRGKAITKESIRDFIEGLDIPQEAKTYLLNLIPHTYVGSAVELARSVEHEVNNILNGAI